MLSGRLYRTCWLVAGVALVVALLTLEALPSAPEPALPSAFDAAAALDLSGQLGAVASTRVSGTPSARAAADWVAERLAEVPSAPGSPSGREAVQTQDFVARVDGRRVPMRNVYRVVPGAGDGTARGGLVVVAPRDTPAGVPAGASGTALMLRLARIAATTRHQRPVLFVSTDGSAMGNAGVRWFLSRFRSFPIAAVVSLDAPGEALGDEIHIWSGGRDGRSALVLAGFAGSAIERAGGRAAPAPGLGTQLLRAAVPQTAGEQGAVIATGIPAVTLAGRSESPLRAGPAATLERLTLAGNAASELLGALDRATAVPPPERALLISGKRLRPLVARVALLLVALPVLVLAVDVIARVRRAHVPIGPGLRVLVHRTLPIAAVLLTGYALVLAGLLPGTAAGAPPLPGALGFDAAVGLGAVLALGAGALTWLALRPALRRAAASPAAEGAAALAALAVLLVLAWLVAPFALVLALPAAHAGLLATAARRPAHVLGLAVVAAVPLLALCAWVGDTLDRNPIFAAWYLLETAASGTRGFAGPLLLVLIVGCVWALGSLVAFRARKGLVVAGAPATRPARRPRPRW